MSFTDDAAAAPASAPGGASNGGPVTDTTPAPRRRPWVRRRTATLGVLAAALAGGAALSYHNANRPCPCPLPPPPTPAPGLAELRAAVTRFNTEHGWTGVNISEDNRSGWSSSSVQASLQVTGDLGETVTPTRMAAFVVGLHEAVDGLLLPPGPAAVPLTARVVLSCGKSGQTKDLDAEIVSDTDHDVLAACMSVAGDALDDGAASAQLAGETLALRHPDPDSDHDDNRLLDPAVWLLAAPASLPAGVVLEQGRDDIASGEFITRIVAGDDMSQVPLADLAVVARGLRWNETTVESTPAGAVVRLSQVLDTEPRSHRPPGVADLRGVLDLARTGTWARWILAEGGDGYRGVVFECTDGTLSVPEVVPALAGTGISLERSREVLAELG
ncbi:hypothetical protein NSA19_06960 [Actinomyces bowdenii]|uniref:hypothetical protein n=1 Tax=Actinomyces bowdenii TaxID=131109 RepID=UPI00214C4322|nr:hypothetical protein [Actinomyces bowdenii]MCR2052589.1 hypothetical protein [Actinomyces bowdenii]